MSKRLSTIAAGEAAYGPLNVMFFVGPFSVRRRPLDYGWVLHRWKPTADGLLRRGHRTTFVASEAVAQLSHGFPGEICTPTSMGIPTPCYRDAQDCDDAWCDLMRNPDAEPWRTFLANAFEAAQPDVVISWTYNAPLLAEAAARGALVVHTELGPVRSPHCRFHYFDPSGYNADTVLEKVWPRFRDRPLTREQVWQLNTLLREHIVRPTDAQAVKEQLSPSGKPLLVHFLQVRRDANILKWAPAGNIPEMLAWAKSAVDADKFTLVVKPHPVDPEGAKLAHERGMTLAPGHISTTTLTSACDLALTCNSSVGFEALCQGKTVYTLGESAYSGRGITRDFATRPEALRAALLDETFAPTADEVALRQRFLHFMFFRYLIPERSFWDADALALRLEHWVALADAGKPREEFFERARGMSVLQELRASARMQEMESHIDYVSRDRAALADQLAGARAHIDFLTSKLERADEELILIKNSATQRAAEQVRAVPGLHAFYLGAKQVVGKLKPHLVQNKLQGHD